MDATQVLLLIVLGYNLRDGILAWYLIGRTHAAPAQPSPSPPAPGAAPAVVVPAVPAPPKPRFHGMATSFGGPSDRNSSAYGGMVDGSSLGVALPFHFNGSRPLVRVFCSGKSVDCSIVDVGPWYTDDPYWITNTPPKAQSNSGKNKAIIDLTPGAWAALGFTGNLDQIETTVDWDFVATLTPPPQVQVPAVVSTVVLSPQTWPLQADCPTFYGDPDSAGWEAANLVDVTCPWALDMSGAAVHTIKIHRKCAASLGRVLDYVWEQCGKDQAQINALHYNLYSGSFNNRNIAGSSQKSMHAYGAAIDWDDAENQQHSTRHLFTDDSLLIKAFKAEGWIWGGDWSSGSIDPMHVQAARVR